MKSTGVAFSVPMATRSWYFPAGAATRAAVQPGFDVVPDHLMLYCTDSPAVRVLTSVPSPGKQSDVDQTRAPAAVNTVNT